MTAQTQAWLDQQDAEVTAKIRKYGWWISYVFGGADHPLGVEHPPFAYTVGLFGMGHPELLIFGVSMDTAGGVLNELGSRIRNGGNLVAGQLITFEGWPHRIVPEEVPNPGEIVFGANRHYQRPDFLSVEVLQLSYDDLHGRFPWELDYMAPRMQPRPGTFRA